MHPLLPHTARQLGFQSRKAATGRYGEMLGADIDAARDLVISETTGAGAIMSTWDYCNGLDPVPAQAYKVWRLTCGQSATFATLDDSQLLRLLNSLAAVPHTQANDLVLFEAMYNSVVSA